MKFIQIKYLTFYLVIFILITCFLIDYRDKVHPSHIPMYFLATTIWLIYMIIGVAYFSLKKIKDQSKYIDTGINIGAIVLAVFTICCLVLWLLKMDENISRSIFIFVFSYQALVVIYAIVIGVLRATKKSGKTSKISG